MKNFLLHIRFAFARIREEYLLHIINLSSLDIYERFLNALKVKHLNKKRQTWILTYFWKQAEQQVNFKKLMNQSMMKLHVDSYHHKLDNLMKLMSDDETSSVSMSLSLKAIFDFILLSQSSTLSSLINLSSTSSSLIDLTSRASSCTIKIRSLTFMMLIIIQH